MSQKPFGWCFLGAGSITRRVLGDAPRMGGARLVSVYARGSARAEALAMETGARAYQTLEEAVLAPGVDAVYVATTNDAHHAQTLAALRLGKPVLCEKPFAINAREAQEMIDTAHGAGVYLMEGMWTRFKPAVEQALRWIAEGRIGRVRTMEAAFCARTPPTARRILDPALGGGGLLDLGVYPLSLARSVFGEMPDQLEALATLLPQGVDSQCGMLLRYPGGAIARLYSSIEAGAPNDVRIDGEAGSILLPRYPFTKEARLTAAAGETVYDAFAQGEGFDYEFNAVMADVREGRRENELVTHAHTLDVMRMMDAVRARIGLQFPQDAAIKKPHVF